MKTNVGNKIIGGPGAPSHGGGSYGGPSSGGSYKGGGGGGDDDSSSGGGGSDYPYSDSSSVAPTHITLSS